MKKIKLLFLLISTMTLLNCSSNDSGGNNLNVPEKVFEGNVTLNTQIQVDDFGSQNYTRINGSLKIIGFASMQKITSLNPLINLNYVRDHLWIESNPELTNLNGLNNVKTVGFKLSIYKNALLSNISALNNINSIGTDLIIEENNSLNNLNGLNSISSIINLTINNNLILSDLNGLSNLKKLSQNLYISTNPQITNIDFLNKLNSNSVFSGYILISNCVNLTNLNGLNKVVKAGRISISSNPKITNLNGLNNVTMITSYDPNLHHSLDIRYNNKLNSIQDLKNITFCYGEISITNNPQLTTLDGLNNIISAGEEISINDNPKLRNFCALKTLFVLHNFAPYYGVSGNYFNPTQQNVIAGNCSI